MEKADKNKGQRAKTKDGSAGAGAYELPEPVLKTRDFMVSGEEFALYTADPNGLLRTHPVPANLSAYYQSEAYISHTDRRKTLFEKLYQGFKALHLRSKVKLLSRLQAKQGRLLDYGSGTGDFLSVAQKAGWEVYGVEPDEGARSRSRSKGVQADADIEALPGELFDIITLWHVLEHLPEPGNMVARLGAQLADRGHMIIAVPNYRSFDAQYYGPFWAAYDTPRHLWHFTGPALKALFERQGFELVRVKPMWLDAFYVSWLSEKYKRNPLAPIRAFLIASISNFLALFSRESSSRIYIFRKSGRTS